MKIIQLLFAGLLLVCALPAFAGFDEGMAAYKKQDFATALKQWRPLAEHGDAWAQNNIGTMYRSGNGVKKDDGKAMQWFRKSADQGNADAQNNIGSMYFGGYNIKHNQSRQAFDKAFALNCAEAMQWFHKAAEQGSSMAMVNIGTMYSDGGSGVEKDYAEAMRWYRKALEQGNTDNKFSIEQGIVWAQFCIAGMYERGLGVKQDITEAMKWYQKAGDQGLNFAYFIIGMRYDYGDVGDGIQQDKTEALKWYHKAAEKGDTMAQGRIDEIAKEKLDTSPAKTSSGKIISSDIRAEDGISLIHLDYEGDGTHIGSVTISLPAGFMFCDPRMWANAKLEFCPSDLFFRFKNSNTESRMSLALPISGHSAFFATWQLQAFITSWELADKYSLIAYDKNGQKFLVEFFKGNLTNNYSVYN